VSAPHAAKTFQRRCSAARKKSAAGEIRRTKCNPESLDLESPESPHTQIGLAKTVGMVIDMTSR